jgi:Uma2 family endonuclease
MVRPTPVSAVIDYPESDGKPMAESDLHRDTMYDLINRLRARYARSRDAYVSGNLLVYYLEGNPYVCLAPDCFVAFGVPNHDRRTYKVWEEGSFPSVVFEITSKTTQREDELEKFRIYRDEWKVKELFFFDPTQEYLEPSLIGYRLIRGDYQPIKPVSDRVPSKLLGITLERDGTRLLLRDAKTKKELPLPETPEAKRTRRKAVELRAKNDQLQAENARMKAELDALRKKST